MTQTGRLCLYYRTEPERHRWVPGDQYVRPWVRRLVRGRPRLGGVEKVFVNLCKGLDRLGVAYTINLPFADLRDSDRVGVLGRGRYALAGYERANPIVAGIGLMTHPSEWPSLCDDYPVKIYLQHSAWACDVYRSYYGDRCRVWPVGIDTAGWRPESCPKDLDFLVYDKIQWNRPELQAGLVDPMIAEFAKRGLTYAILRYGEYDESEYRALLARSRAMLFLCGHESQGLACQEGMSCDVPVLAWDQGLCLDPDRFAWGMPTIPATSVPYFDARCGETFRGRDDFAEKLDSFVGRMRSGAYRPREYVLETLTLERCSAHFLEFFEAAGGLRP